MLRTPHVETAKETFHCRCTNNHPFTAQLLVAINTGTDPELVHHLEEDGTQVVACPVCDQRLHLAEPVLVHDPGAARAGLLIPSPISHQTLHCKASLTTRIANQQGHLPTYFGEFVILATWMDMLEYCPKEVEGSEANDTGIHKAFADLASIIPEPPESSNSDEE